MVELNNWEFVILVITTFIAGVNVGHILTLPVGDDK
jgi:hypothetical protein